MKILAATDGSDHSNAAIDMMCSSFNALADLEIMVVSVYEDQFAIAAEPFAISGEYYQRMVDAYALNAKHFAEAAAERIRSRLGRADLQVEQRVPVGPPEKMIVEAAKDWGADLIVVGSHGRGFWGRLLGSVSDGVIHHAPCSVLVVRTDNARNGVGS